MITKEMGKTTFLHTWPNWPDKIACQIPAIIGSNSQLKLSTFPDSIEPAVICIRMLKL